MLHGEASQFEARQRLASVGKVRFRAVYYIRGGQGHEGRSAAMADFTVSGPIASMVPTISWPGTIPAGQVYEHPVSALDVAATAAAIAKAKTNTGDLDGVNLIFHGHRRPVPRPVVDQQQYDIRLLCFGGRSS